MTKIILFNWQRRFVNIKANINNVHDVKLSKKEEINKDLRKNERIDNFEKNVKIDIKSQNLTQTIEDNHGKNIVFDHNKPQNNNKLTYKK